MRPFDLAFFILLIPVASLSLPCSIAAAETKPFSKSEIGGAVVRADESDRIDDRPNGFIEFYESGSKERRRIEIVNGRWNASVGENAQIRETGS